MSTKPKSAADLATRALTIAHIGPGQSPLLATPNRLIDIKGVKLMGLGDPRLTLTLDEITTAVMEGCYERPLLVTSPSGRKATVHAVHYKGFVLYVLWGFPADVQALLDVQLLVPTHSHSYFCPFLIGVADGRGEGGRR